MFYVDGKPVEFVKSYPHLGHIINARMDDTEDISHRRGAIIGQVNNVLCYFSTLNSHTKYRLFQSYCTSFYGCELWCLLDDEVQGLCTAWRKSIRKIWECHIEHTAIFCLCYAVVILYLTSYAYVHLTLYKDVLPIIQMLLNLFLTIALSMVVAILVLVRM